MGLLIVFIIFIIYVALSRSVKQSNNQNRSGNNPAMGQPPQQTYRPQMNQPQRTYQQAPNQPQQTYRPQMNQPQRAYQQASAQPHPVYQQVREPQMNRQQTQQQLKNRLAEKYQTAATEKTSAMEVIEPLEFTYDIPQSDNMKKVQELIVTGFSGNLNFERDFVAEGIEMLNRFDLQ